MSSGSKSSPLVPASGRRWRCGSRSSRTPCSTRGCPPRHRAGIRAGTLSSMYQTICFFGGESLAFGSAFSSRQRLICRTKLVSGSLAEVLRGVQEVADAVVGQSRLVARVGQLDQAVMDHDGDPARVDHAVVANRRNRIRRPPPVKVASTCDLDVVRERLDLVPGRPVAVEAAEAQAGRSRSGRCRRSRSGRRRPG